MWSMRFLLVACLFFKSCSLQCRQQCVFWELMFLKCQNLEFNLHQKMKAENLSPKRKFDVLRVIKRSTKLKCTKNILRSISLPQLLQLPKCDPSPRSFVLLSEVSVQGALQKAPEQTLFYRAFAGFVYPFGMLQWGRRFEPGPLARWCN